METVSILLQTETSSTLAREYIVRILMFGRGVIATIYGRVLQGAGHEVEFYVRSGRAAEYGSEVTLDWIDGRHKPFGRHITETFATQLRESLAVSEPYDLIILSVGHHRLAEAASIVAPHAGDATVLVFGNIWEEPADAVAPIEAEQLVFGFPLAGGGFSKDGVLSGALLSNVIIGESGDTATRREQEVHDLFHQAGLSVRRERDMRGWLWLHFIADAGMFSQALRSGSLAEMVGDRRAFRAAFETTRDLLPLLRARGVDIRRHRSTALPFLQPRLVAPLIAWATARIPFARRNLAAHTDPQTPEALAVIADTLREAKRLGIPAGRLAS